MAKIKGTAYFCKHRVPAPESFDPQGNKYPRRYEVQIVPSDVKALKKEYPWMKVHASTDQIPGNFIKISTNCPEDKHVDERRPAAYMGKKPFDNYIFNGSLVNVIGEPMEFNGRKKFVWRAIQVLEPAEAPEGWEERQSVDIASELDDVEVDDPNASDNDELNDDLDDI